MGSSSALYTDGGVEGGSIVYDGPRGLTLANVKSLVYNARETSTGDSGRVAMPYLRIFLEDAAGLPHDMILKVRTPNSPTGTLQRVPFHEWVATSGLWRYDDDVGSFPDVLFADLVEDHGTEEITMLVISVGNSGGVDLNSLLRWWRSSASCDAEHCDRGVAEPGPVARLLHVGLRAGQLPAPLIGVRTSTPR